MSHYLVWVTNTDVDSLEAQLAPFNEQGDEDDFYMQKEYIVKNGKESVEAYIKPQIKDCEDSLKANDLKDEVRDYWKRRKKAFENILKLKTTKAQLERIQEWEGGRINKIGLYYVYNPEARWDWWSVGGRWKGWLKTKDGKSVDSCYLKDIDFDKIREEEIKNMLKARKQELEYAKQYNREPMMWGFDKFPTEEEIKNQYKKPLSPYAILHEGDWISKGDMGWFGMSNDKYTDEDWDKYFYDFIGQLPGDTKITIVDCHI